MIESHEVNFQPRTAQENYEKGLSYENNDRPNFQKAALCYLLAAKEDHTEAGRKFQTPRFMISVLTPAIKSRNYLEIKFFLTELSNFFPSPAELINVITKLDDELLKNLLELAALSNDKELESLAAKALDAGRAHSADPVTLLTHYKKQLEIQWVKTSRDEEEIKMINQILKDLSRNTPISGIMNSLYKHKKNIIENSPTLRNILLNLYVDRVCNEQAVSQPDMLSPKEACEKGRELWVGGQIKEAIECFNRAAKQGYAAAYVYLLSIIDNKYIIADPKTDDNYRNYYLLQIKKNYDWFKNQLENFPDSPEAQYEFYIALKVNGENERAHELCERSYNSNSLFTVAWLEKNIDILFSKNTSEIQKEEAVSLVLTYEDDKTVTREKTAAEAYLLARFFAKLSEIENSDRNLKNHYRNRERYYLGAAAQKGHMGAMHVLSSVNLSYLRRLADMGDRDAQLRYSNYFLKNPDKNIRDETQALKYLDIANSRGEDADVSYRLGMFYKYKKNLEEAKKYFLKAAGQQHLKAKYQLANLYYKNGNLEESERYLYSVLLKNKDDFDATYLLGKVLYLKGKKDNEANLDAYRIFLILMGQKKNIKGSKNKSRLEKIEKKCTTDFLQKVFGLLVTSQELSVTSVEALLYKYEHKINLYQKVLWQDKKMDVLEVAKSRKNKKLQDVIAAARLQRYILELEKKIARSKVNSSDNNKILEAAKDLMNCYQDPAKLKPENIEVLKNNADLKTLANSFSRKILENNAASEEAENDFRQDVIINVPTFIPTDDSILGLRVPNDQPNENTDNISENESEDEDKSKIIEPSTQHSKAAAPGIEGVKVKADSNQKKNYSNPHLFTKVQDIPVENIPLPKQDDLTNTDKKSVKNNKTNTPTIPVRIFSSIFSGFSKKNTSYQGTETQADSSNVVNTDTDKTSNLPQKPVVVNVGISEQTPEKKDNIQNQVGDNQDKNIKTNLKKSEKNEPETLDPINDSQENHPQSPKLTEYVNELLNETSNYQFGDVCKKSINNLLSGTSTEELEKDLENVKSVQESYAKAAEEYQEVSGEKAPEIVFDDDDKNHAKKGKLSTTRYVRTLERNKNDIDKRKKEAVNKNMEKITNAETESGIEAKALTPEKLIELASSSENTEQAIEWLKKGEFDFRIYQQAVMPSLNKLNNIIRTVQNNPNGSKLFENILPSEKKSFDNLLDKIKTDFGWDIKSEKWREKRSEDIQPFIKTLYGQDEKSRIPVDKVENQVNKLESSLKEILERRIEENKKSLGKLYKKHKQKIPDKFLNKKTLTIGEMVVFLGQLQTEIDFVNKLNTKSLSAMSQSVKRKAGMLENWAVKHKDHQYQKFINKGRKAVDNIRKLTDFSPSILAKLSLTKWESMPFSKKMELMKKYLKTEEKLNASLNHIEVQDTFGKLEELKRKVGTKPPFFEDLFNNCQQGCETLERAIKEGLMTEGADVNTKNSYEIFQKETAPRVGKLELMYSLIQNKIKELNTYYIKLAYAHSAALPDIEAKIKALEKAETEEEFFTIYADAKELCEKAVDKSGEPKASPAPLISLSYSESNLNLKIIEKFYDFYIKQLSNCPKMKDLYDDLIAQKNIIKQVKDNLEYKLENNPNNINTLFVCREGKGRMVLRARELMSPDTSIYTSRHTTFQPERPTELNNFVKDCAQKLGEDQQKVYKAFSKWNSFAHVKLPEEKIVVSGVTLAVESELRESLISLSNLKNSRRQQIK